VTTISEQILELAFFNSVLHPRDSHGRWIKTTWRPDTFARENARQGWPSEVYRQKAAHERDKAGRQQFGGGITEQAIVRRLKAEGNGPETIRSQLAQRRQHMAEWDRMHPAPVSRPWTPAAELKAKQHDNRRAGGQTWTVDEQGQIIRHAHPFPQGASTLKEGREAMQREAERNRALRAGRAVPVPHLLGAWQFVRGGLISNQIVTEPRVGDQAKNSQGVWGTVISVAGGHAAIDANDRMRHLVDWRNGGVPVHTVPLSEVGPALPAVPPHIPGAWNFRGTGIMPRTGAPKEGDLAQSSMGLQGRVVAVAGGHVVVDAPDGMRRLIDWKNGGVIRQEQPISQMPAIGAAAWARRMAEHHSASLLGPTKPPDINRMAGMQFRVVSGPGPMAWVALDPHPPNPDAPWLITDGAGNEHHVSDTALRAMEEPAKQPTPPPPSPSPPGVMVAPGVKQYLLPGMPSPPEEVGHNSPEVRKLQEITEDDLAMGDSEDSSDGIQGTVEIVTLPSGEKVVHKKYLSGYQSMPDADELSYYVSQVVGAGAPPVARLTDGEPDEIIMGFVPGEVAGNYSGGADTYDLESEDNPQGHKIGVLDYLISNPDRHDFNWMITPDDVPVPIDMSGGFASSYGTNSPFWHNEVLDTAEYEQLVEGLATIKPEFHRLGHDDWYTQMISRLNDIAPGAAPGAGGQNWAGISAQALDLGWRFNPAEKRDAHGQWSRGAGYMVPRHERLLIKKNKSPINYPHPEDHPFFRAHPVSPANVIAAYRASSDQEKAQGMRWYADAHMLAAKMADGDARKGAILLAAYSPQASWPVNMFNSARAAEEHRALGPGDGLISGAMQANAQEALDGATVDEALQAPKTRAFAHLIENGGDAPSDTKGHVVIDRHALSVAMGVRLPDNIEPPIGKARYHEYVADQYREAARQLNEQGTPIAPHQLQAITWLHQQSANLAVTAVQAADPASPENARAKGRTTMLRNAWAKWAKYAGAEGLPLHPGTTSLAQVVSDWNEAVELAVWEHELRDRHGRWTRGGVARVASDLASGIASHKKLGDGLQGRTEILTLNNGQKAVQKTLLDWQGHPAKDLADSEELAATVADAVEGTGAPAVHRSGPKQVTMAFSKGVLAERYLADRNVDPEDPYDAMPDLFSSPRGLRIGMLDYLIDNPDRHSHNYLMDGDKPVPIDNSSAYGTNGFRPGVVGPNGQKGTVSPFTRALFANPNGIPEGEVRAMEARLRSMQADFASHGRSLWHTETMIRWANYLALRKKAAGLATISGQAVELAELRDSRGRWTRFGAAESAASTAAAHHKGFSVSVRTGESPPGGYMVAQVDHTHTYPAAILDDHAKLTRAIDDMIMAEKNSFTGKQAYLGGWVHDGKLWLEPSDNFASKSMAVAAGRSRNQISVYSLPDYAEIPTGGSGGGRITEHANQGAGQGPGGLRGPARGRAAGDGSRAGHGGSIRDQVLLAWHFNPLESRDDRGRWSHMNKWLDGSAVGRETPPSGEDIPPLQGEGSYESMHKAVRDFAAKGAPLVPGLLGGGREAWNGKVTVGIDDPDTAGQMSWSGELQVSGVVARSIEEMMAHQFRPVDHPDSAEVLLHEFTHADIGGSEAKINEKRRSFGIRTLYREEYSDHQRAYQDPATGAIEEGFTELATIHHAPEFLKAMGIGERKVAEPGVMRFQMQTLADMALAAQDPVKIKNGSAWGHYGWQTAMAQDWVQQVAQDEGHGDLRMSTPGYARTRELSDEINREGASRKVNVMARQVIMAALKDSPDAPLLTDEIAMARVEVETRRAILEAWSGQEAAVNAHRAAVRTVHQTAHTERMAREGRAA